MNLIKAQAHATMSSVELATLTGKDHSHVLRDIRNMLKEIYPEARPKTMGEEPNLDLLESKGIFIHKLPSGFYSHVDLPKRECLILVSGYSIELRAKIIDRWQELEAQQGQQFKIPQTYSEALRLCADQAEHIEQQQALIEHQRHAVEFVERYVEAKSSKSLSDVAKVLGLKPQTFIKQLAADNVIFKRGGSWIAYQDHIDAGRFTVNTGETNGHAYVQTRVEPKGVAWLAKKYGNA